jgi:hypothetical protein
MAIDGYMFFKDYNDAFLVSESQVNPTFATGPRFREFCSRAVPVSH